MNARLIALPILLLPFILAADDAAKPPMKPPAAIAATKKYDASIERATNEYNRAMQLAEKQLIADLEVQEKVTTKSGSLDEAIAIRAAKNDAEDRLAEIPKQSDDHHPESWRAMNALAQRLTNTKWDDGGHPTAFLPGGTVQTTGPWVGRWAPIAGNAIIVLYKGGDGEFVNLMRFDPSLTAYKATHGHLGDLLEGKRLP